jgi:hypothetical protein
MCKQGRSFLLVSIMFVVAISKIPSQVVEEVTTLVRMMMVVVVMVALVMVVMMMMMMVVVMVVVMLIMMYITIPSSHFPLEICQKCVVHIQIYFPLEICQKCVVHIQIWFPVQAKKFIPKSYTQVSVFFFLAKFLSPVRLAIFIFTFANWQ